MEGNGSVVATVATTAPVVETAITGTQNETPIDNVETQSIETTETTQTNETADDDSYSLDSETEAETETTEEQVALTDEKFNEIIPDESIREIAKSIFGDGITEEQAKKFLEAVILDEQKQDAQRAEEIEGIKAELQENNFGLSSKAEFDGLQNWVKGLPAEVRKDFSIMTSFELPKEVVVANIKLINTLRKMSTKQRAGVSKEANTFNSEQSFAKKYTTEEIKKMYVDARMKNVDGAEIEKLKKQAKYSGISDVWINTVLK